MQKQEILPSTALICNTREFAFPHSLNSGTSQGSSRIVVCMDSRAVEGLTQRKIEDRRQTMTVLIAWGSLAVGIVLGAMWRSLCEKQSRHTTNIYDGSANLHRLNLEPQEWKMQRDQAPARQKRPA
jgi:hypothetical protein